MQCTIFFAQKNCVKDCRTNIEVLLLFYYLQTNKFNLFNLKNIRILYIGKAIINKKDIYRLSKSSICY